MALVSSTLTTSSQWATFLGNLFLLHLRPNDVDFFKVIGEKDNEYDIEIHYKDTFKAFSKDKDGNFKLYLICCTK